MIEFPYYPLKQKKLHPAEEKMLCRDKIIEIHQTGFRGFVSVSVCWVFFSLFIYLFIYYFLFYTTPERFGD